MSPTGATKSSLTAVVVNDDNTRGDDQLSSPTSPRPSESLREGSPPKCKQAASLRDNKLILGSSPHRDLEDPVLSSPCPQRKRALSSSSLPSPSELKRNRVFYRKTSSDLDNGPTPWQLDDMNEEDRAKAVEVRSHWRYPKKSAVASGRPLTNADYYLPASDDLASVWSMHQETSEADAQSEANGQVESQRSDEEAEALVELEPIQLRRGQDVNGYAGGDDETPLPSVVYYNVKSDISYQSKVDKAFFNYKRFVHGNDPEMDIWLTCDRIANKLFERCVDLSEDPKEEFPILHRHGGHKELTGNPLTLKNYQSESIQRAIERQWDYLIQHYGGFHDIQHEHRALIDKAFNVLCALMRALATRDIAKAMIINRLFKPFQDAFDELSLSEYVLREFCADTAPKFISATNLKARF